MFDTVWLRLTVALGSRGEAGSGSTDLPHAILPSSCICTLWTARLWTGYNSDSSHLHTFSDDSAIVGCISDGREAEYRGVVNGFVAWCGLNHLQLNTDKTKGLMVVDFRRRGAPLSPVSILGVDVQFTREYKYLGVYLDSKLDWSRNAEALYKKGQSRLYCLRRLCSLNVCSGMLQIFYQPVVASAIFFAAVCWGSRAKAADASWTIQPIPSMTHWST